jgi:serine/threonine-protein kinase PRP4
LIAERRRRRQEILAKHSKQQDNGNGKEEELKKQQPMEIDVLKDMAHHHHHQQQQQQQVGMDTDDMEDSQVASGIGEARNGGELSKRLHATGHHQVEEENIQSHKDDEEEEDIFAATPEDAKHNNTASNKAAQVVVSHKRGLVDNYDDAEGYYNFQVGEILADRYEVFATHGRGVFSSVLRARDLGVMGDRKNNNHGPSSSTTEVAIKMIRSNETMYKAGQVEKIILNKLSEADPDGKRHVIRMLSSFEYRNHLCLVFESMDMNLRELTKRYGRGIGLSIGAVRVYANQLLVALHHLQSCGVIHADIKPDNILVNESRNNVKICDFGSAMFAGDNAITPYLVSRFYRAPEIILGLQYDYPLDMWSIGCVVYELLTGKILFPGRTNNEMLKYMMDVKGQFPKKMVKKAEFAFKHFEGGGGGSMANVRFALIEEDKISKRPVRRVIANPVVKKDFMGLLAGQAPDRKKLGQLADLLERMMVLDPEKRITPREALRHPFIIES